MATMSEMYGHVPTLNEKYAVLKGWSYDDATLKWVRKLDGNWLCADHIPDYVDNPKEILRLLNLTLNCSVDICLQVQEDDSIVCTTGNEKFTGKTLNEVMIQIAIVREYKLSD